MDSQQYYVAPKQEIFDEIKAKAIEIWKTYDNTFGYVDEKLKRIERIENVRDNCGYIVAMFDVSNQNKLLRMVEGETKEWLQEMLDWSRGY